MTTTELLPNDPRRQSKFLYWIGWRICEIAEATGKKEKTLHSRKARDKWDRADNVERIGGASEARLVQLILKEGRSGGDFKEIDLLHRQLERQARIQRFQGGGIETELNPNLVKRNEGPKKKTPKNEASGKRRYGADDWFSMSANGSPPHWPAGLFERSSISAWPGGKWATACPYSIVAAINPHRI